MDQEKNQAWWQQWKSTEESGKRRGLTPNEKAVLVGAYGMMARELVQGSIDRFAPGLGLIGKLGSGLAGLGASLIANTQIPEEEKKQNK